MSPRSESGPAAATTAAPPMEVVELELAPPDNARLANLCGALDDNLGRLARALTVDIRRRGGKFRLAGPAGAPRAAAAALRDLYARADRAIAPRDVQLSIADNLNGQTPTHPSHPSHPTPPTHPSHPGDSVDDPVRSAGVDDGGGGDDGVDGDGENGRGAETESSLAAGANPGAGMRWTTIKPQRPLRGPGAFVARTAGQQAYLEKIRAHDLTICAGPAGAGKTYLAVAAALESARRGETERLILTRPAVEAGGEKLGFLPGDMEQKVNPYLRPLHDALHRLLGRGETERRLARSGRGAIEIIPLAFMRGLTLERAFVILDEAQNTAPEQMKMLLTRLGPGSKIVVAGDDTQSDLPPDDESGLADALRRLRGLPGVAIHRFALADIVRHPLTRLVIRAYEDDQDERA